MHDTAMLYGLLGGAAYPRIEVELAFALKRKLEGNNITIDDVLNAADYVTPAVEIIDARIEQFDRHTEAPRKVFDTISDNAANAGILLGGIKTLPRKVDLPGVNALKQVKWCWQGRSPGLLRLRQAMCLTPTLDG